MMKLNPKKTIFLMTIMAIFCLILSACSGKTKAKKPTVNPTELFQSALLTATYGMPTASPIPGTATPEPPTATPLPTATVPRTPPALPATFQTEFLNSLDTPHTYVQDTCQYLRNKWDPNNSAPGTVLMPIMFHGIAANEAAKANDITHGQLEELLNNLKSQGFEAINMQQAADFMTRNAKIPNRSVLLIVDDRHNKEYYLTNFESKLKEYNWPLINAWISLPDSITTTALPGNIELSQAGWVDYQAHGVVHNTPISEWPDGTNIDTSGIPAWADILRTVSEFPAGTFYNADQLNGSSLTTEGYVHMELGGARALIEKNFGKAPVAYIWPGGGFSSLAVRVAGEVGYTLGFTINPRGPVMYNWVPLLDETDPSRPSYMPEGKVGNPLMVLPRYWDTDASYNIDNVRQIGKQAAAAAEASKQVEIDYYDIVCSPTLGPLPAAAQ